MMAQMEMEWNREKEALMNQIQVTCQLHCKTIQKLTDLLAYSLAYSHPYSLPYCLLTFATSVYSLFYVAAHFPNASPFTFFLTFLTLV